MEEASTEVRNQRLQVAAQPQPCRGMETGGTCPGGAIPGPARRSFGSPRCGFQQRQSSLLTTACFFIAVVDEEITSVHVSKPVKE